MKTLKISLCQINPTVGDLAGNSRKIVEFYKRAEKENADLVIFPELALTGYPPEDLLLKESFVRSNLDHLRKIAKEIHESIAVIGFVHLEKGKIFDSAAIIQNGKIQSVYSKKSLPNYGVFDEKRYFQTGKNLGVIKVKDVPIGISICEDIWETDLKLNSCLTQAKAGAKILVNISASPYHAGKFKMRLDLLKNRVRQTRCPILYNNAIGGQDELIFDGRSMVVDQKGKLAALAKSFAEDIKTVEFEIQKSGVRIVADEKLKEPLLTGTGEIYEALVLGTRDYVQKNGFKSVVIGLSGGIDSSLVACIAADALGVNRVWGISMPSCYSSTETRGDAEKLAKNLGIHFLTIPIEKAFRAFLETLAPAFEGIKSDITEENLQSRIRGILLMALSNKFGHLVLTTGNKSEVSVGYSTLYGDSAGGFAVIKDVPKTLVYKLSALVNQKARKEIIPQSVIDRAPTAELRPNQKDQDTLPPYDALDEMIRHYVEEDKSYKEILRKGFDRESLIKVIRMIDANEYKRRQSPPGIKITPKSFGKDRRMPITNRFVEY